MILEKKWQGDPYNCEKMKLHKVFLNETFLHTPVITIESF